MPLFTRLLPVAAYVLMCGAAAAQDLSGKDPHWIQDRVSMCWAANPDPAENESIAWTGGCRNGLLDGEGELTWYIGGRVVGRDIGMFKDGQLSGKGAILFSDGARYDGEFPGLGVLTAPDGRRFPAQSVQEPAGWSIEQINPDVVEP